MPGTDPRDRVLPGRHARRGLLGAVVAAAHHSAGDRRERRPDRAELRGLRAPLVGGLDLHRLSAPVGARAVRDVRRFGVRCAERAPGHEVLGAGLMAARVGSLGGSVVRPAGRRRRGWTFDRDHGSAGRPATGAAGGRRAPGADRQPARRAHRPALVVERWRAPGDRIRPGGAGLGRGRRGRRPAHGRGHVRRGSRSPDHDLACSARRGASRSPSGTLLGPPTAVGSWGARTPAGPSPRRARRSAPARFRDPPRGPSPAGAARPTPAWTSAEPACSRR